MDTLRRRLSGEVWSGTGGVLPPPFGPKRKKQVLRLVRRSGLAQEDIAEENPSGFGIDALAE